MSSGQFLGKNGSEQLLDLPPVPSHDNAWFGVFCLSVLIYTLAPAMLAMIEKAPCQPWGQVIAIDGKPRQSFDRNALSNWYGYTS